MILSLLLSLIFFGLGLIHFNWLIGGTFGISQALPTNERGERVLNPKKIDSGIVGLGLSIFGVFYLIKSGLLDLNMPSWILEYGGWVIPVIFILRSIGDFKYIGFFKKIKETSFGRMDTKFYSPLCLFIGLAGIFIQCVY